MGNPIVGDTFLILLNADQEPVPFVLPAHEGRVLWEPVLDTRDWDGDADRPSQRTGEHYRLAGPSLPALRPTPSPPPGAAACSCPPPPPPPTRPRTTSPLPAPQQRVH